jgi:hypothetical protein
LSEQEIGGFLGRKRALLETPGLFEVCLSGLPCLSSTTRTLLGMRLIRMQKHAEHKMGV